MRLTEIEYNDSLPVDGYGPGFFRVGGEVVQGAICLGPDGLVPWGGLEDVDTLLALVGKVDVLFVGTGGPSAP